MWRTGLQMTCFRVLSLAALVSLLPFVGQAWATPIVGPPEEVETPSTSISASDPADFASQSSGLLAVELEPLLRANLLQSEGEPIASASSSILESAALGSSIQQQGETLDQVLRSLAIVHEVGANSTARTGASPSGSASADYGADDRLGFGEMILSSTFAGTALRSVLEAHADGDAPAGFSVFGFGNFILEADSGSLELADVSNGWSVALTGERGASDSPAAPRETAPDSDVKRATLVWWLVLHVENFLVSPLGIVIETIGVLVLIFWIIIQGVAVARLSRAHVARRASRSRGPKAAAARRTRRRTRRHRRRRSVRSSVA
jgi:hypothetical protein